MRWGVEFDMDAFHSANYQAALVHACQAASQQAALSPDVISEWRRQEMQDAIRAQVAVMRQSLNNALRWAVGRKVDPALQFEIVDTLYCPALLFVIDCEPQIVPPRSSVMQPHHIDFLG